MNILLNITILLVLFSCSEKPSNPMKLIAYDSKKEVVIDSKNLDVILGSGEENEFFIVNPSLVNGSEKTFNLYINNKTSGKLNLNEVPNKVMTIGNPLGITLTKSTCGGGLSKNRSCVLSFKHTYVSGQTGDGSFEFPLFDGITEVGESPYLRISVDVNETYLDALSETGNLIKSLEIINFGTLEAGQKNTQRVYFSNKSIVLSVDKPLVQNLPQNITVIKDTCQNSIPSKRSCFLDLEYNAPSVTEELNVDEELVLNSSQLSDNSITIIAKVLSVEDPNQSIEIKDASMPKNTKVGNFVKRIYISNASRNMLNLDVNNLVSGDATILSSSCGAPLYANRYCYVDVQVVIENDGEKKEFQVFQTQFNKSKTFILGEEIIPNRLCIEQDVINNGWDISNYAEIEGIVVNNDTSTCLIKSCQVGFDINSVEKKCDAIPDVITACTEADLTELGYSVNSNSIISGDVVNGNKENCMMSCKEFSSYDINDKACVDNIVSCTPADLGLDNSVLVNGIITGDVIGTDKSQCDLICNQFYTETANDCVAISRPCETSDVSNNGWSIDFINEIEGEVVANDITACQVKNCQANYELSVKSCIPVERLCTIDDFTPQANLNGNGHVEGIVVGGNTSACGITCENDYILNNTNNSCEPRYISCEPQHVIMNGWLDLTYAVSFSGLFDTVTNNPSQCAIDSCAEGYEVDNVNKECAIEVVANKMCDEQDVTNNGWNVLNAKSFTGYVENGDISHCKISACQSGYTVAGKKCYDINSPLWTISNNDEEFLGINTLIRPATFNNEFLTAQQTISIPVNMTNDTSNDIQLLDSTITYLSSSNSSIFSDSSSPKSTYFDYLWYTLPETGNQYTNQEIIDNTMDFIFQEIKPPYMAIPLQKLSFKHIITPNVGSQSFSINGETMGNTGVAFNNEFYFTSGKYSKMHRMDSNNKFYQVTNINNSTQHDSVVILKELNNELYFTAKKGSFYRRLFKINKSGTVTQVSNLNLNSDDINASTDKKGSFILNNELYFVGKINGFNKILKVNISGVLEQVSDMNPNKHDIDIGRDLHFASNSEIYFIGLDINNINRIYSIDSSGIITKKSDLSFIPKKAVSFKNELYTSLGNELIKIKEDGSIYRFPRINTYGVDTSEINPEYMMFVYNNELYFAAKNTSGHVKFYKTDGENIVQAININNGSSDEGKLFVHNNNLYMIKFISVGSSYFNILKYDESGNFKEINKAINNVLGKSITSAPDYVINNNDLYFICETNGSKLHACRIDEKDQLFKMDEGAYPVFSWDNHVYFIQNNTHLFKLEFE